MTRIEPDRPAAQALRAGIARIVAEWEQSSDMPGDCADRILAFVLENELVHQALREVQGISGQPGERAVGPSDPVIPKPDGP